MSVTDNSDSSSDIVKNFITTLEANEKETAANYLASAFTCTGWAPRPLYKDAFLNVMAGIKAGIPGLMFNLHNLHEPDVTTVTGTIQVAGYQSDSFILPELGTPPIPQTASSVSLPPQDVKFALDQSQITAMNVQHVPGGGVQGLLRQLGIDLTLSQ